MDNEIPTAIKRKDVLLLVTKTGEKFYVRVEIRGDRIKSSELPKEGVKITRHPTFKNGDEAVDYMKNVYKYLDLFEKENKLPKTLTELRNTIAELNTTDKAMEVVNEKLKQYR